MTRDLLLLELVKMEPELKVRGVSHLALFGSRARQDNRPDSDIDLALDVEPGARFSLISLIGVEREIEDHTRIRAHALMRRSLEGDLRNSVLRDAIEIF